MKITYARFKNMKGFYNGMNLKDIEFNFDINDNRFFLLAGGNGSGKTTLESLLTPFPTIIDIGKSKIVRDDKKGYKEIHYRHKKTKYICKIYYEPKPKGGHTTKCFLTKIKNGVEEELNPNGNVTSYLEVVEEELDITSDMLKILRLGDNVENIVNMNATDRKRYINNFIPETALFDKYFKNVNETSKVLRSLLKNLSNKLDRIGDIDKIKLKHDDLNEKYNSTLNNKNDIVEKINFIKGNISALDPDDEIESKLNTMQTEYDKLNKTLNEFSNYKETQDEVSNKLDNFKSSLNDIRNSIIILDNKREYIKNSLNDKRITLSEIQSNINKISIEDNIGDTKNIYKDLIEQKTSYEDKVSKLKFKIPDITRDELVTFYDTLTDIQNIIIDGIYNIEHNDFSLDLLNRDISFQELNKIDNEVSKSSMELNNELNKLNNEISKNSSKMDFINILKSRPTNCDIDDCPFVKEAVSSKNIVEELNNNIIRKSELENDISILQVKVEGIQLYRNYLDYIGKIEFLNNSINRISIRFTDKYNMDYIKEVINKKEMEVFNNFDFTLMIDFIEERDNYNDIVNKKLPVLEKELSKIENQEIILSKYNLDKDNLNKDIKSIMVELQTIDDLLNENKDNELNTLTDVENYEIILDNLKNKNDIIDNAVKLSKDISTIKETYDKIILLKSQETNLNNMVEYISKNIEVLFKEIEQCKFTLNEASNLLNEKSILEENFKDVEIVKKALSPTKGMPLVFMQIFLQRIRSLSNKLLKNVFNGEIMLDEFIITEKEFRIPCVGKGEGNDDVCQCSQGENSLINLIFSFALAHETTNKYNILYLDEMDGPLDENNRAQFLFVVDKIMEALDIEQIFIISHNNMIHNFDTNLILLKGHTIDIDDPDRIVYKY